MSRDNQWGVWGIFIAITWLCIGINACKWNPIAAAAGLVASIMVFVVMPKSEKE